MILVSGTAAMMHTHGFDVLRFGNILLLAPEYRLSGRTGQIILFVPTYGRYDNYISLFSTLLILNMDPVIFIMKQYVLQVKVS